MIGNYKEAFPDFGEMDVALPGHFQDMSWSNEACPCFHSAEARVFLYVDYIDPAKREFPEMERFGLLMASEDGQHLDEESRHLLHTDDFALVLAKIEARRAEFSERPSP